MIGGFKVNDPALDLVVCFADAGALLIQVITRDIVGLGGEVCNIGKIKESLLEVEKLRFVTTITLEVTLKGEKLKFQKIKK